MLHRLGFPAVGRHRRFVVAIGLDALGSGVWMPMSVLYFTVVTHESLVRIGFALSLASALAVPFALVAGHLVDRYGARRVLQVGNVLQAVGFAAYPLAHAWWSITIVAGIAALGRTLFWGSFPPLVTAVTEPGERETWFGFLGALRNSGFAVGGIAAAAAIGIGSTPVFHVVVLTNAASYLVSFALVARVSVTEPHREPGHEGLPGGFRDVLADRGYRWLIGANAGYALGCLALNVVMPIYLVRQLGLPGWLSGVVYVVNTVMIGLGQGLVVRRMGGARRWRIITLAAGFMAAGFVLMYVVSFLGVAVAVAVALVAAGVYTLGEMVGGPVLSALAAESPPPHLRGRYMAAFQLSWNGSAAIAPLLYLWLLDVGHLAVWSALTLIVLLGAACCLPLRRRMSLADQPVTNAPLTRPGEIPLVVEPKEV